MSKRMKSQEDDYAFPYRKPPPKEHWLLFFFDPQKGTVLGRTAKNWGALVIFYTIFYIVLAIMFSICMYGLLSSCKPDKPNYITDASLIGSNPGMGYRPYPDEANDKGTVIWFRANDPGNVQKWTSNLDRFLDAYTNRSRPGYDNRVDCQGMKEPPPGKVCDVAVNGPRFGPCTAENHYSYNRSSPCLFIKLNRIYGWDPQVYTKDDIPEKMGDQLKETVRNSNESMIWVECYGMDSVDKENIGPIKYYPRQGFASYYYPYENGNGYVSPLVAIHFERPALRVLINVECRAWAKNIKYGRGREHASGSVHIELMVDD